MAPLSVIAGQFDRKAIESAVEFLIALLDAQDGDPDLEPDDDDSCSACEDWFGYPGHGDITFIGHDEDFEFDGRTLPTVNPEALHPVDIGMRVRCLDGA